MIERLRILKARGFHPKYVDDIGANRGEWTAAVREIWPAARFFLVEPTAAHERYLKAVVGRRQRSTFGHQAVQDTYVVGLVLGNATREVAFQMHQKDAAGTGNSIFTEAAAPAGNFAPAPLQMHTLDGLHETRGQPPPHL